MTVNSFVWNHTVLSLIQELPLSCQGTLGILTFLIKSVMGRLWDNHFRQLGHPPKFYRVQDASSGNNSPFWYHVRPF